MKNYVKAGSLAVLCLLCSCAQTAQGKLRQAVYDTASAYHLLASPMPDIMAGRKPECRAKSPCPQGQPECAGRTERT